MEIAPLPEDLYGDAVALWHDAELTRPWNPPYDDLRRAMGGPASTVLAATDDGALLGTAMVGHDGHRGWVYYLAVAKPRRGQGIGAALMRACENWLRHRDIPKVNLMVRGTNRDVIGFYEHLGYTSGDSIVLARALHEEPPS